MYGCMGVCMYFNYIKGILNRILHITCITIHIYSFVLYLPTIMCRFTLMFTKGTRIANTHMTNITLITNNR